MPLAETLIQETCNRALTLFDANYNCAEAVATAAGEALTPGQNVFPRLATILGGGCGRRGETCGALIGALMAISSLHGRRQGEGPEAKKRCYDLAEMVVEDFKDKHGTLLCRELTGVDLSTREGQKAFDERQIHKNRCAAIVQEATRLALTHGAP